LLEETKITLDESHVAMKVISISILSILVALLIGCTSQSIPTALASNRAKAESFYPNLVSALQNYDYKNRPPLWVACFGPSVLQGATLPDATTQADCQYFVSKLQATYDPTNKVNFEAANFGVNGTIQVQFPAAWQSMKEALGTVSIADPGAGYSVGDVVTVDQNALPGRIDEPNGAIIVTAVNRAGEVTGIRLSPYVNIPSLYDTNSPSQGGYVVESNVPTFDGYNPLIISVAAQTGRGRGLSVNIIAVGIKPALVLSFYAMNDATIGNYNSGQTYPRYATTLEAEMNIVRSESADFLVVTSPHPSLLLQTANVLPNIGGPCWYVGYTDECDASLIVPDPASSVVTKDFAGLGTPVEMDARMLDINSSARQVATQAKVSFIDAEAYWFAETERLTKTLGSQSLAEGELFLPGQYVHPDLLGHQASYDAAINDFMPTFAAELSAAVR
jgi:hypothetical protein